MEQEKVHRAENLHLEIGDALNLSTLERAVAHFQRQPITVINEGLMRYLSFEQKAQYAKNIASLLKTFGGVWIAPDITLKGMMDKAQQRVNQMTKELGASLTISLFESEPEARKFFEDLGFTVEVHPFREIEQDLVSPKKLAISEESLADMLDKPVVYAIKLR